MTRLSTSLVPIRPRIRTLSQGLLGRLFNNKLSGFAELYASRARTHRRNLVEYQQARLKERVLRSVLEAVDNLLERLEDYFDNLMDVKDRLEDRVEDRATEHEGRSDPTRRFILATREHKEHFWRGLRTRLASSVLLTEEIAEEIYIDHYDRYYDEQQSRQFVRENPTREGRAGETAQQFEDTVVEWCRYSIQEEERLNLNIIQALREEARRQRNDETEHMKDQVDDIENLARPLLNPRRTRQDDASTFNGSTYWGAHPESVSDPSGDDDRRGTLPQDLSAGWFGGDLIRHSAFSRYELTCYRNLYGTRAANLRKFSAGGELSAPGPYYRAYRERVRRITGESDRPAVTPHLDRRWHLPVYLADTINPQETKQAARRVDQAFIRGLVHGIFQQAVVDKETTWRFEDERGTSIVHVHGKPCSGVAHSLHEALQYNPVITDRVMDHTQEIWEDDKGDYPINRPTDIANHSFHEGCHHVPGVSGDENLMDAILGFAQEAPGKSEVLDAAERVLQHAFEEIDAYYTFVYGEHQTNKASRRAGNLIERLQEDSHIYQETDNEQLRQTWDSIIDRTVEEFRE